MFLKKPEVLLIELLYWLKVGNDEIRKNRSQLCIKSKVVILLVKILLKVVFICRVAAVSYWEKGLVKNIINLQNGKNVSCFTQSSQLVVLAASQNLQSQGTQDQKGHMKKMWGLWCRIFISDHQGFDIATVYILQCRACGGLGFPLGIQTCAWGLPGKSQVWTFLLAVF